MYKFKDFKIMKFLNKTLKKIAHFITVAENSIFELNIK